MVSYFEHEDEEVESPDCRSGVNERKSHHARQFKIQHFMNIEYNILKEKTRKSFEKHLDNQREDKTPKELQKSWYSFQKNYWKCWWYKKIGEILN